MNRATNDISMEEIFNMHNPSPQACSYHEAGHAVALSIYDLGLVEVDIIPQFSKSGEYGMGGANWKVPQLSQILTFTEVSVMPYLVAFWAGFYAERMINPSAQLERGTDSDGDQIGRFSTYAICKLKQCGSGYSPDDAEVKEKQTSIRDLIAKSQSQAEEFVTKYATAIKAVASVLLEDKHLTASQIRVLIQSNAI